MFDKVKIFYPIGIALICILIAIGLSIKYYQKYNNPSSRHQNQPNKETLKKTDYTDYSSKTLSWLNRQRTSQDWYLAQTDCDQTSCNFPIDVRDGGNQDALIIIWARFNFYQNHKKNQSELEIIKKDLSYYLDNFSSNSDGVWTCKIMYQLWQSNLFDSVTKDKIEKFCFNHQYPYSTSLLSYFDDIGKKISQISESSENKKTIKYQNWDAYQLMGRGFDSHLGYTSDFISRYLWKNDKADLKLAKDYLDLAKKQKNTQIFSSNDLCLLGISSLDYYQISQQPEDLAFVEEIYNQYLGDPEKLRQYQSPICGILVNQLYDLTSNKDYFNRNETINKLLIDLYWDGNTNKSASDGAFFWINEDSDISFKKNIVQNGLMIILLN